MSIKSTENILFAVRQFATSKEEYDFAVRILAERALLPYEGNDGEIDGDYGFSVISRGLREEIKKLQQFGTD
jgi:hypothetical protein